MAQKAKENKTRLVEKAGFKIFNFAQFLYNFQIFFKNLADASKRAMNKIKSQEILEMNYTRNT
jgi:hypothetical protein